MVSAKKHTRVFIAVIGSGEFAWDMLRYDECFPAQEGNDSAALMSHRLELRCVVVGKWRCQEVRFQTERWASFGWQVIGGRCFEMFDNPQDARRAGERELGERGKRAAIKG